MPLRAGKRTLAFFLGDMLSKSVAFLLLPLLTNALSPSEYGIAALFLSALVIAGNVVSLSVHGSVAAQYYRCGEAERDGIVTTGYELQARIFAALAIGGLAVAVFLPVDVLGPSFGATFIAFVLCNAYLQGGIQIALTLQRLRDDWKRNLFIQSAIVAGTILGTIIPLMFIKDDWKVRAWGVSAANIVAILLTWHFFPKVFATTDVPRKKEKIKDHFKFGVGLIPHNTSYWVKSSSDRYMIVALMTTAAAGIYSAAFQLASVIGIAAMSLHQAMQPLVYRELAKLDQGHRPSLKKVAIYVLVYMAVVTFGLIVWTLLEFVAFDYVIDAKYAEAKQYIAVLTASFGIHALYLAGSNFVFFEKRTLFVSMTTFVSALVHVLIAYVGLRAHSLGSVAWALMISNAVAAVLVWAFAARSIAGKLRALKNASTTSPVAGSSNNPLVRS